MHKQNAYAQLCVKLSNDLQREIFTDEKEGFKARLSEQKLRIESLEDKSLHLESIIASKEQEISRLKNDFSQEHDQCQTVTRTNEVMQSQLVKLNSNEGQYHQTIVELRMQGLDFKTRYVQNTSMFTLRLRLNLENFMMDCYISILLVSCFMWSGALDLQL